MDKNKNSYKTFSDSQDANNWGEQHYAEWAKGYELCENPIAYYCGNYYNAINAFLRGLDRTKKYSYLFNHSQCDVKKDFTTRTNKLKEVLLSAPRIPENIVVYRYTSDEFVYQLIENSRKKDWTYDKGFLSTSLTFDIVKNNSEPAYLLKIYVSEGTVGVYTPCVAGGGELEMLLYPNCALRIVKPFISKPLFLRQKIHNKLIYECELLCPVE